MKQALVTDEAPSAPAFLSQAIVSNGLIFVSGQVHALPDSTLVGGTVAEKVSQIMKNIEAILRSAHATLDDIVKIVIYVTDMALMPQLNEVYPNFFTKPYPVREAICVKALPLGADIEMSAIAATQASG